MNIAGRIWPMHPVPMTLTRRRSLLVLVLATTAATAAGLAPTLAWSLSRFPDKPISLPVPFGPGCIAELTARALAEHMSKSLGQAVVVKNKPSAGSIVASQAVATAKPDGHTLLLMNNGNAVSVGLFRKLPFDAQKDFAPITTLGYFDIGLFVAANSKFTTLQQALAFAKANPARLNVGTIATGSTQHLSAKLFETAAGIDLMVVPYKGSPGVLTALRAGEIDIAFEIAGPVVPRVTSGVIRALAASSDKRNPALPDVPTVMQAGVTGYNVASWNALAAPVGTPPEVLDKLDMRLQGGTAAELQALLASEIKHWDAVIRASRIELE